MILFITIVIITILVVFSGIYFFAEKNNSFENKIKSEEFTEEEIEESRKKYNDQINIHFKNKEWYYNEKNEFWKDKHWLEENLFKNNVITEKQYYAFRGVAGIYRIRIKINGKNHYYVGQSDNLSKRIAFHIWETNNNKKNKQLVTNCINKYHSARTPLNWWVIEEIPKNMHYDDLRDLLDEREIGYIGRYNKYVSPYRMMNRDEGGIYYGNSH